MSQPAIPDATLSTAQGITQQAQDYPYQYLINLMAALGQSGSVNNPNGGTTNVDFTGLGTADVQNQYQNQMAQTLLNLQQTLGPQFVQQQLQDLQQSDPTGFAAYQQLAGLVQQQNQQPNANLPESEATQQQIQNIVNNNQTLSPDELTQVQNAVRGGQVGNGIYLGNAPAQAEADSVVQAQDAQQQQAQNLALQFLQSGETPQQIQEATNQQNIGNLNAFVTGQNPTNELGQVSGAQAGAAPFETGGFSMPGLNESQAAGQGINQNLGIYNAEQNWSSNTLNPYLAGFSTAAGTGSSLIGGFGGAAATPGNLGNYQNADPGAMNWYNAG